MEVVIKRVDKSLPLPEYKTNGAVAFDFITRETTTIPACGIGRIPGNVVIKIPAGYMLFVRDRSSTIAKKGLLITAGIIDQDFCGDSDEILLQFLNPTDKEVVVERGERIAQGIFVKVERATWKEVEQMHTPSRGGFGTTDSKNEAQLSLLDTSIKDGVIKAGTYDILS